MTGGNAIYTQADIFTQIRPPESKQVPLLAGKTLISTIQPSINGDLYQQLTAQHTNVFALDCVPRMLSRGQTYDILSSQANIAGYRSGTWTNQSCACVYSHRFRFLTILE